MAPAPHGMQPVLIRALRLFPASMMVQQPVAARTVPSACGQWCQSECTAPGWLCAGCNHHHNGLRPRLGGREALVACVALLHNKRTAPPPRRKDYRRQQNRNPAHGGFQPQAWCMAGTGLARQPRCVHALPGIRQLAPAYQHASVCLWLVCVCVCVCVYVCVCRACALPQANGGAACRCP